MPRRTQRRVTEGASVVLWLCIALPQLPLEALRSDDTDAPLVVTACEGSARWVVCGNPAAQNARLKPDMNYTVALALCPAVRKLERSTAAETSALERLGAWAYQFSSTVILGEVPPTSAARVALVARDRRQSQIVGGFAFHRGVERELGHLHYSYQLGIGRRWKVLRCWRAANSRGHPFAHGVAAAHS